MYVTCYNIILSIEFKDLKFKWQPGGQSDMVWCYSDLQI